MFRKFLEPKIERRIKSLNELHKYLDERWLAKSAEKEMAGRIEFSTYFNYLKMNFQNMNPMSWTHHSTPSTVISRRKINYFTHSHNKESRQLLIGWQRKIAFEIGFNHPLSPKRRRFVGWRLYEIIYINVGVFVVVVVGGRFRFIDSFN